ANSQPAARAPSQRRRPSPRSQRQIAEPPTIARPSAAISPTTCRVVPTCRSRTRKATVAPATTATHIHPPRARNCGPVRRPGAIDDCCTRGSVADRWTPGWRTRLRVAGLTQGVDVERGADGLAVLDVERAEARALSLGQPLVLGVGGLEAWGDEGLDPRHAR